MHKKLISIFILLFILIFLIPVKTYAIENFDAVYNVTYDVKEDTNTHATIHVSLTNKTDKYYPASYALQIGFNEIKDLKATDPGGQLAPKVTKNDKGQKIELEFNTKAIGKNKTLNFTISFDTPDVAKRQGKVWEINVPGIANPDEFADFNVEVKTPSFLENPIYIKPEHDSKELKFSKEKLGKSGIAMAFGTNQIYDFKLKYHLENDNIFPIKKQIALPPTTNYQEVFLDSVTPKPENVTLDKDGNWIAEYILNPTQKLDILAKGKVELSLTPKKDPLSKEEKNTYLAEKKYWEVNSKEIQELARLLKTPENIYKYVTETLKYDFSRVNTDQKRLGAVAALTKKEQAVCLEFTDLFIAISRAAGIPAREVNGFAFTENTKQRPLSLVEDILHAWPEYYSEEEQTWIMVDPTWGNTTGGIDYFQVFDLDHFVFVRKGIESTSPLPAGAYKIDTQESRKDIVVTFSNTPGEKVNKFEIISLFNSSYATQIPIRGKIQINNTGQTLIPSIETQITSTSLTPNRQIARLQPIPPYGKQEVNIDFESLPLLTNGQYEFTMNLKDQVKRVTFKVIPFNLTLDRVLLFTYVVIAAIIIWAVAQGTWRLLISKRKK